MVIVDSKFVNRHPTTKEVPQARRGVSQKTAPPEGSPGSVWTWREAPKEIFPNKGSGAKRRTNFLGEKRHDETALEPKMGGNPV